MIIKKKKKNILDISNNKEISYLTYIMELTKEKNVITLPYKNKNYLQMKMISYEFDTKSLTKILFTS